MRWAALRVVVSTSVRPPNTEAQRATASASTGVWAASAGSGNPWGMYSAAWAEWSKGLGTRRVRTRGSASRPRRCVNQLRASSCPSVAEVNTQLRPSAASPSNSPKNPALSTGAATKRQATAGACPPPHSSQRTNPTCGASAAADCVSRAHMACVRNTRWCRWTNSAAASQVGASACCTADREPATPATARRQPLASSPSGTCCCHRLRRPPPGAACSNGDTCRAACSSSNARWLQGRMPRAHCCPRLDTSRARSRSRLEPTD